MKTTYKWVLIGSSLLGSAMLLSAIWLFVGHFRLGGAFLNGHGAAENVFSYGAALPNLPFGWLAIAGVILIVAAGSIALSAYDEAQSKADSGAGTALCPACGLEIETNRTECPFCGEKLPEPLLH